MFRTVLARSGLSSASMVQRQVQIQSFAAFHSSSAVRSSNDVSEIFSPLFNNGPNSSSTSTTTPNKSRSSLFANPRANNAGNPIMPVFGYMPKANTTANPIHLDINHPSEGRSIKVNGPSSVDSAYRRLRTTLNQSNMKRELRLKRTYETGHVKMRREAQEQNKRLFGNLVRKKIQLIKLMKLRGM
ncbi:small subunit ribosomal protein S21 [Entomortierella parvispora]|uniref:Small subunit ribosomal protein S21 n=1 Tax=Entomortierella parvispora TaxID=205924 RepID=A0A9P3HCC0_9FUNG|nr:small subunit ribosomal protein S21 [Entomortierella parvispora]